MPRVILTLLLLCQSFCLGAEKVGFADPGLLGTDETPKSRVFVVKDPGATRALEAVAGVVDAMVAKGVMAMTGRPTPGDAWRSLVAPTNVVGVKVHSVPGPASGTRPAVVAAVVRGLLDAGHPAGKIVIWDRRLADLRAAGFQELAASLGVRVAGAVDEGFDAGVAYENAVLGQLVFGDLEFERGPAARGGTNAVVGRRSHFSRLLTQQIQRHVVIAPLLNHNHAGVSGMLYTMASASTDNFLRFEIHPELLAKAVPEIYGDPVLADRVALLVVDALLGQYEGSQKTLLHYSAVLNELRFGTDPVALDVQACADLNRIRREAGVKEMTNGVSLLENARLLELGTDDPGRIHLHRVE